MGEVKRDGKSGRFMSAAGRPVARKQGATVGEGLASDEVAGRGLAGTVRGPRLGEARVFTRKRVARAWPEITEKFLQQAKTGSCTHAAFLVKMSGMDLDPVEPMRRKKRKTLKELLLEDDAVL